MDCVYTYSELTVFGFLQRDDCVFNDALRVIKDDYIDLCEIIYTALVYSLQTEHANGRLHRGMCSRQ